MAGPYRVERPTDVEAFLARSGGLLEAHEAENNLMLGLCGSLRKRPLLYGEPARFAVVTGLDGRVAGAALQTPPYNLVLAFGGEVEAADALADSFGDDPLPGVNGPVELAARFADRWRAVTGQAVEAGLAERIFRLTRVRPPRPTTGSMRLATIADRRLLIDWLVAFAAEALDDVFADAEGWADTALGGSRPVYFWTDAGRTVSLASAGGPTANGVRVGPVYTPPEHRGRGYASNLVAAVSQAELDKGRRFVFLYTDLANPTSNKIYQDIGYEPVLDVQLYRFEPSSSR